MNDWMPIETAPKDGTEILVFKSKVASSDKHLGLCRIVWWDKNGVRGGFWRSVGNSYGYDEAKLIYWMPLPKNPVTQKPQPELNDPKRVDWENNGE